MIVRTTRRVAGTLAALVAPLIILGLFGLWRLSAGPVQVEALTPLIEDALGALVPEGDLVIGATWVEWAGWRRIVGVRLDDARLIDTEGDEIVGIPRVDVALRAVSLARGRIVPTAVTVHQPRLHLRRGDQGFEVRIVDGDGTASVSLAMVERLLAAPDPDSPGGRLERIDVLDATLSIEDAVLGRRWTVPASAFRLWRVADGVDGDLQVELLADGRSADLVVMGGYRPGTGTWEAAVAFGDVRPGAFAALDPALSLLDGAGIPLTGTITVSGDRTGAITAIGFDVSAEAGILTPPPEILAALGDGATPPAVSLEAFTVRGRWVGADRRLEISALHARFAPDTVFRWTGPVAVGAPVREVRGQGRFRPDPGRVEWEDLRIDLGDAAALSVASPDFAAPLLLPLRSLVASGTYDLAGRALDLTSLAADLEGPMLTAAATVAGPEDARSLAAAISLTDLAVDQVARYWPEGLFEGPRSWVTGHLSDGTVPAASLRLAATAGPDGIAVEELSGSVTIEGATVDYLPPLPPVRGASGVATLGRESVTIDVSSGTADGVAVDAATIRLLDLDTDLPRTVVEVAARGAVPRIFELIDRPPLHYARAVGIDPAMTAGRAEVDLTVSLPLLAELPIGEVDIYAEANLDGVRIAGAALGRDIHDGRLALRIDNDGVDLAGSAALATIEGKVLARENFSPAAPFRRRIHIDVPAAKLTAVQSLFFADRRIPQDVLAGDVGADIDITQRSDNTAQIDAVLDFRDATVDVPYFGWTKDWGAAASARITATFAADTLRAVPGFSVDAEGLHLEGSATFDANERLERVDLARVISGRTDTAGAFVHLADGGWSVAIRGTSLDLEPLLSDLDMRSLEELDGAADDIGIALTVDAGTVWIARDRHLRNVAATLAQEGGVLQTVSAEGRLEDGSRIALAIRPGEDDTRMVSASSENAGETLRAFDLFDGMTGGRLTVEGRFDDTRPSRPLSGTLRVRDYHIRNAPALAQFLGMVALTEIGNTLRGEGLSFRILEVPFTFADGLLTVRDARASGLALGFTAGGTVDLKADAVDLRGTVVPVYAINSALGRLPVVGYLFRGEDKGGGLFAATYVMSGPLDDVDVLVNPLAALTPGALRHVFDVLESPPRTRDAPAGDAATR